MYSTILGSIPIPPSAPDLSKYCIVDMYTRCTETSVKESILKSFNIIDGNLRVIIGTIAFGDCPNVRQLIHWGPSADLESYVQETGRAGRDGYLSRAVLFNAPADYHHQWCITVKIQQNVGTQHYLRSSMKNRLYLHSHFVIAVMYVNQNAFVNFVLSISILSIVHFLFEQFIGEQVCGTVVPICA